jgi:hypothetical protein
LVGRKQKYNKFGARSDNRWTDIRKGSDFMYLSTLINTKNVISEEIKSRIAAGNRCFCSQGQILGLEP